jgi:RNA-binding protein 15
VDYRHSSGDLREERLGGTKERGFNPRRHENLENHDEIRGGSGGGGRDIGSVRKGGNEVGPTHHSAPGVPYYEKFEYSLHVSNLGSHLSDNETKMNLFREFKKFGFVNIKVIGYGKDRHAFINFTRLEDASSALSEIDGSNFFGENLEVTWSRSTLNRYPHIGSGNATHTSHTDQRRPVGGRVAKSRSFPQEAPMAFFNSPTGRNSDHFQDSPRNSRDINYHQHSSPSRNHAMHSSKEVPIKPPAGAIVDPNATRTLFVGNLEADVTERELRDLFSPYGRIECVDIKIQRSISTAYAFVKFFTITDAMNAKNDMHGSKYGQIKLKIGFGKGSPSAKVWVGNLTSFADLSEVRTELDRFGLIRRVDYNNGDSHAFVHFDSLDAAQTAVNSLTTYRFRSSNRPLKIDLSQPIPRPGSDFEDYDSDFHEPIGTENSRHVHSSHNMSPDINPRTVMSRSRGGGSGAPEEYGRGSRQLSRDGVIDHRIGVATIKSSFRSNRGRRVVTNVQDHTHSRNVPGNNMGYHSERGNYRKRVHSPTIGGADHRSEGFNRHHSERGGAHSDNSHRMGGAQNGDFEYKAKRPKNGFDAYQYHKMHGISVADRIGSVSSSHSGSERDRDKDFRDKEFKDRHDDRRHSDHRGERRERDPRNNNHDSRRSSSARSDRKGEREDQNLQRKNSDSTTQNIEKISPPPPPPPPPIMEMMTSYETSDPALKLNDSTGPVSPTAGGQSIKADFQVETLSDMTKVYPVVWHGNLVLKNTGFPTRMLLIGGDPAVAELLLRCKDPKDDFDALRITQRLRLEPPRLEEVNKRMSSAGPSGHCILLALPGAIPAQPMEESIETSTSLQLRPLKSLVSYLDQKEAAGIVALNTTDMTSSGAQRENIIGVLHAFPPCEFSQKQLLKIAPNLGSEPAKEDHVVVLLVKGTV